MPTDTTDTFDLESLEAVKAALEIDAGIADWAFRELSSLGASGVAALLNSPLLDYVRKSDVHLYIDFVRVGGAWHAIKSMRSQQNSFTLQAKKIGCPRYGRLCAQDDTSRIVSGRR